MNGTLIPPCFSALSAGIPSNHGPVRKLIALVKVACKLMIFSPVMTSTSSHTDHAIVTIYVTLCRPLSCFSLLNQSLL